MSGRSPDNLHSAFFVFDEVTLRAGNRRAFPRTNWVCRACEQWAILGSDNSGKSLLAQALAGRRVPVRGEIRFSFPEYDRLSPTPGVVLVSPDTHRAAVAEVSSFYQSRWHSGPGEGRLTVSQFLAQEDVEEINPFEVNPRRSPRAAYARRRRTFARLLGIGPLRRRKLTYLSNGEMRRVLLVRALLQAPRLLVLDEPFAGLDAQTRVRLRGVIRKLMQDGLKMLVVTSRPDEIPEQATHVLLVNRQRVAARGTKSKMLRHPLVKHLRAAQHLPSATTLGRQVGPGAADGRPARTFAIPVAMDNVTIRGGSRPLLNRVTWTLRRGEHWALLGPNGSGKTTLLSLIQGDHPQAYAQNIRLFGIRPDSTQALWQARQFVGWLSPELHLHYPLEWSCLDAVCSGFFDSIGLYQACTRRQHQRARHWLRRVGLPRHEQTPLGELSPGGQRLVLLARALVKRPRLLVLDEPCQSLDRAHRQLILTMVDQLVSATGVSLIFVTHHPQEMPACITHVLELKAGRIAYAGPRQETVWQSPRPNP